MATYRERLISIVHLNLQISPTILPYSYTVVAFYSDSAYILRSQTAFSGLQGMMQNTDLGLPCQNCLNVQLYLHRTCSSRTDRGGCGRLFQSGFPTATVS